MKQYANPLRFFDDLVFPASTGARRFADCMADHQREWFDAIAPSLVAVAKGEPPPCTRFWTERTKGGSKDTDTACALLWLLAFSRRKLDIQVGAADRDQAGELKKAATDVLRLNPWLANRVDVQAWTLLCKSTGSECVIVSTDVAGSHGARPDVTIVNELSHIQKEEFASNLLDNATKKPHGLVIIATNAGFEGSWQYRWRELARTSDRWNFHAFSEPAPWLSEAEIEEARRRNSRSRFDRLFYGGWQGQSGDALDLEDIAACVDPKLSAMSGLPIGEWGRVPHPSNEFAVGGLDLGIKHDHSALVVVHGNRSTQELRLAWAESWAPDPRTGKIDLMRVETACVTAARKYGIGLLGFDPYQAMLLAQRLGTQRIRTHEVAFTGANLNEMASTLLEVIRGRRLRLYPHAKLVADLKRLTIEEKSYGYRLSAVRDSEGHADLATALAIALPIAVEWLSKKSLLVGGEFQSNDGRDYAAVNDMQRRSEAYAREMQRPSQETENRLIWREILYALGGGGRLR